MPMTPFIFSKKDLQNKADWVLRLAKQHGINEAEVSANIEHGFSVSARDGDAETLEHHDEKSLNITVYSDKRMGSASTSDLSELALIKVVEKACSIAKYTQPDPFSGLAEPALLATHFPDLDLYHHWDLTPEAAIEMAVACELEGRAVDSRITRSEG